MLNTNSLIKELQENNRLLRAFLPTHPAINSKIQRARLQSFIDSMNLQDEWAEKYGECIPPIHAAKIIGKTQDCIHKWAAHGYIVKSSTGGVLTRSLAAYVESDIPQGKK